MFWRAAGPDAASLLREASNSRGNAAAGGAAGGGSALDYRSRDGDAGPESASEARAEEAPLGDYGGRQVRAPSNNPTRGVTSFLVRSPPNALPAPTDSARPSLSPAGL
jgi:hypothetical protein